jgi:hypothetical protein
MSDINSEPAKAKSMTVKPKSTDRCPALLDRERVAALDRRVGHRQAEREAKLAETETAKRRASATRGSWRRSRP